MTGSLFVLMLVVPMLLATVSSWPVVNGNGDIDMHVRNELDAGRVLNVHCHCTDHDLGNTKIKVGAEYYWRFKTHFIRKNLWQCYLVPDTHRYAYFHVFDEDTPGDEENIFWVAKEDGIYYRYPDTSKDEFRYKWDSKV